MAVKLFGNVYRNRRVLVTGHTGFKGSWLSLWLDTLGAKLTGIALAPETRPNHWDLLDFGIDSRVQDIRDASALAAQVRDAAPEIVFHLAAQPLVRRSYRDPLGTWQTNVMGTANLLDACRGVAKLKAVVVITSDKCYENQEWPWGYRETDRLGGHDAYSASKAASELVAASYRKAFFQASDGPLLATARAGNVIGGGDWSEDRLIPDLIRAVAAKRSLEIRSPQATRPWQHVLESLSGYLLLGQRLFEGRQDYATAWNFGPDRKSVGSVVDVLTKLQCQWPALQWHTTDVPQPHEATLLELDSAQARCKLGWQPRWDLEQALGMTAKWYREYLETGSAISRQQLATYCKTLTD